MKIGIVTVSDSRTEDTDVTGNVIKDLLEAGKYRIDEYALVTDDADRIRDRLIYYADVLKLDLVLTAGGTGFGPRDVTPEVTSDVSEKDVPGIPELMRGEGTKGTPKAALSRGKAGIRKNTLIVNLPGSPQGAKESLKSILPLITHAIDMLKGKGH